MAEGEQTKEPVWLPLESNPDVLTKLAHAFGANPAWQFTDVWGLDDDVLDAQVPMFAAPVIAVLFLFPSNEDAEARKLPADENAALPVYFLRQTKALGNACGTIGVIHSLANLAKTDFPILGPGALQSFLDKTKDKTPEERGNLLAFDEELRKIHDSFAQQGQTAPPSADEHVNFHFISFLSIGDRLWSLDGMRALPTDRGTTSTATFLKDCAKIIKSEWLAKNQEENLFSVIALTQLSEDD